jgi:hypothetical protein
MKPHPNPCENSQLVNHLKAIRKMQIMKQIITKIFHFSSLTPRGFSFTKKICKNILRLKKTNLVKFTLRKIEISTISTIVLLIK